ncbi:hypothetical protein [Alicyclobacillus mengziensis]|uniref:Uncharacterized protein n=1 Tax=Alicyclobacillus mengziensis TaxID=2931921 RepID=A0A9X7VZT3_9BACL|nr:hypothetical protein [Alicyclobacillus mengziensis]QSO46733.1 hypothetical protein JZ786_20185 [Alicyclobacillus mengziensis]
MRKPLVRSSIPFVIAIGMVVSLGWQYLSNRIQEGTFNRLNSGLYKAMVFTELHGKRTYQPHGRYYYVNLYDAQNLAMVQSYLKNYVNSHDSSVSLRSITFRMPDYNNLIGLATVAVHVLPGVTKNVELNDSIPLMHFTHQIGST